MDSLIPQESPESIAFRRELENLSKNLCMVYNPTDEDYRLILDSIAFYVPHKDKDLGYGKGKMQLPFSHARKYVIEMTNKILIKKADDYFNKLNDERQKKGMESMSPKEREKLETPMRSDNPELRKPLMKELFLGVVAKYGAEDLLLEKNQEEIQRDFRPMDDQIFDTLTRVYNPQVTMGTSTIPEPSEEAKKGPGRPRKQDEAISQISE